MAVPADPTAFDALSGSPDGAGETLAVLRCTLHDLRTPLGTLSGWLEVLETYLESDSPLVEKALIGMRRAVERQQTGLVEVESALRQCECRDSVVQGQSLGELLRRQARARGVDSLRLAAFDRLGGLPSMPCPQPEGALGDAIDLLLGLILRAATDESLRVQATPERLSVVLRSVDRVDGPLRALCTGDYSLRTARGGDCSAARLWAARVAFQRAGITLRCATANDGWMAITLSSGRDSAPGANGSGSDRHDDGSGVTAWLN